MTQWVSPSGSRARGKKCGRRKRFRWRPSLFRTKTRSKAVKDKKFTLSSVPKTPKTARCPAIAVSVAEQDTTGIHVRKRDPRRPFYAQSPKILNPSQKIPNLCLPSLPTSPTPSQNLTQLSRTRSPQMTFRKKSCYICHILI